MKKAYCNQQFMDYLTVSEKTILWHLLEKHIEEEKKYLEGLSEENYNIVGKITEEDIELSKNLLRKVNGAKFVYFEEW